MTAITWRELPKKVKACLFAGAFLLVDLAEGWKIYGQVKESAT